MGKLLPEFWLVPKDEDSAKSAAPAHRSWKVTDIFSWLQCYATYSSVLGRQFPEAILELLEYMVSIDAGRKSMPPFIQCASQEMPR